MPYLRVLDDLRIALHRRMPDLQRLQTGNPLGGCSGLQPLRDELRNLVLAGPGILVGEGCQTRLFEGPRQCAQGDSDKARWPSIVA